MNKGLFAAITTIQPPSHGVLKLAERLIDSGGTLIVAGDQKGPGQYDMAGTLFLSLQDQLRGPFSLSRKLPTGHYCRKNVAYLEAILRGAECIYETDDDNAPLDHWKPRHEVLTDAHVIPSPDMTGAPSSRWVNVYRYFTESHVWPRGFPLDVVNADVPDFLVGAGVASLRAPIQQSLVAGEPDVDAIWRLTSAQALVFQRDHSIYISPGNWCPFNTQATWWWPIAYPLLYIPSYCSFRMCDIWKSFVAQACLWQLGFGVGYHSPDVTQERNPHDLMRDFADEVPGYLNNTRFPAILSQAGLRPGTDHICDNLYAAYLALVRAGLLPDKELELVKAWIANLHDCKWDPAG